MRDDHEELLAHNPVLLARCFWHFARKFEDAAQGGVPALPSFCVAAAMMYHAETVEKVRRMNFDNGLLKVITDRPDLLAGLQTRLEAAFTPTLRALQLAVSSGLMLREDVGGLPGFRAVGGEELPLALRDPGSPIGMTHAARRLGAWLGLEAPAIVRQQLHVEF